MAFEVVMAAAFVSMPPASRALARCALPALLAAGAVGTASAHAQEPSRAEQLRSWVADPSMPAWRVQNLFSASALSSDEAEAIANEMAGQVDDREAPADRRGRALRLLGLALARVPLPEHRPEAQERIARAVARAVTDPDAGLRRLAIGELHYLNGRPERLDWLLEGQVCLRSLLRARDQGTAPPDPALVIVTLDYLRSIAGEAAAVLPLLEELLSGELPEDLRHYARLALAEIGRTGTRDHAVRAFASCGVELRARAPRTTDPLPERSRLLRDESDISMAMGRVLAGHPDLLSEPPAADAFLGLLERFTRDPKDGKVLSRMEQDVVIVFLKHADGLLQIGDDAVRQRVLARCDAALQPFADHANGALRRAAQRWLQR